MASSSEKRYNSQNSVVASDTTAHDLRAGTVQPPTPIHDEPFSHGFFDNDEGTVKARREWLKISIASVLMVWFVIWAILAIYWAALGRSSTNIHNLTGYVVDFDGGSIGHAVMQAFASIHSPEQMSWLVIDASQFPNGPSDVEAALLDDRCWAAVTINPGATTNLATAINAHNGTYDTSVAVTAYITTARSENVYRGPISAGLNAVLTSVSNTYSINMAKQLASRTDLSALMSAAPLLVTQPLGFALNDLRPFDVPVASAVDFVGLIYLLILSFMLTNQLMGASAQSGFGRRLKLKPLILKRIFWPIILYFFVSLMYSLLSLAFGVPFGRKYGHGGFVIYWMMSWVAMMALGLALESMITILTIKFIAFFLVLWIIANVSVAFYPIEVLPAVFRYGYSMPFYNVSKTVRTIVFDTKNQIGLNFGVQLAWVVVSCITLPFFQWFARRQEVEAWRKSQTQTQEKA